MLLVTALFAVTSVVVTGTIAALLLTVAVATALLIAALIVVIAGTIAALSWRTALQICSKTFGTESAFVVAAL